jgi:hypothetical protein
MGSKKQAAFNTGIVLCLREKNGKVTIYRSHVGIFNKETTLSNDEEAERWLRGYSRCIALMLQWPDDCISGIYVPLVESKLIAERAQGELILFLEQYQREIVAFQQRGLDG